MYTLSEDGIRFPSRFLIVKTFSSAFQLKYFSLSVEAKVKNFLHKVIIFLFMVRGIEWRFCYIKLRFRTKFRPVCINQADLVSNQVFDFKNFFRFGAGNLSRAFPFHTWFACGISVAIGNQHTTTNLKVHRTSMIKAIVKINVAPRGGCPILCDIAVYII